MGTKLVCPNCGCDTFRTVQNLNRDVIVDSEGVILGVVKENVSKVVSNRNCTECGKKYGSDNLLVTKDYFYNVLCKGEEDNVNTNGSEE